MFVGDSGNPCAVCDEVEGEPLCFLPNSALACRTVRMHPGPAMRQLSPPTHGTCPVVAGAAAVMAAAREQGLMSADSTTKMTRLLLRLREAEHTGDDGGLSSARQTGQRRR